MKNKFHSLKNGPKPYDWIWLTRFTDFNVNQKEFLRVKFGHESNALIMHGYFIHGEWRYSEVELCLNNLKIVKCPCYYDFKIIGKSAGGSNIWSAVYNPRKEKIRHISLADIRQ